MKKELFCWEWKKLWCMPMFGVFLGLCILFNLFLVYANWYAADYVSYVSDVTETIGGRMGADFDRELLALPEHEYKEILIAETAGAEDIFEEYQAKDILSLLKGVYLLEDKEEAMLTSKYEKLQESVALLAKEDASLDVSAAGMTYDVLDSLFQVVYRAILTESWLLAVLMALYLSCSENLSRTAHSVYSSKTGRAIQKTKYAVSALSSIVSYVILNVIGIGSFCLFWDMNMVWNASMSSQFHYRVVAMCRIPFITWVPMTVWEYFLAMLCLGAVVVLIFHAISFGVGMAVGDSYKAFLTLSGVGVLIFIGNILAANGTNFKLYQLLEWNPIMLWWKQYKWFTDMDLESVIAWQECWEAVVCVVMSGIILAVCRRYFSRKDMKG